MYRQMKRNSVLYTCKAEQTSSYGRREEHRRNGNQHRIYPANGYLNWLISVRRWKTSWSGQGRTWRKQIKRAAPTLTKKPLPNTQKASRKPYSGRLHYNRVRHQFQGGKRKNVRHDEETEFRDRNSADGYHPQTGSTGYCRLFWNGAGLCRNLLQYLHRDRPSGTHLESHVRWQYLYRAQGRERTYFGRQRIFLWGGKPDPPI